MTDSYSIQNYFKRGKTVVLTLKHGEEDASRSWSDKETNELLKLMNTFLPVFQNDSRRKKDVWGDISKEMQKSGLNWTPEDLRKKWSNMIRTFRGIEEQKQQPLGACRRIKWPFYDGMKELLSAEGSDALPEAVTVSQLIKGVVLPTIPPPANFARKTILETPEGQKFLASQPQHHLNQRNSHTLQMTPAPAQFMSSALVNMHLVHDPDVFEVNDASAQIPIEVDSDASLLMDHNSIAPSFSGNSSSHRRKSTKNKKANTIKKEGKQMKTTEESTDDIFLKFMETTQKQNEQLLDKMTTFHENALMLMQERNNLLREIRDGLNQSSTGSSNNSNNVTVAQPCHHDPLGNNEVETETLTLHMGPVYSTNPGMNAPVQNASIISQPQLNPTLVISDQGAAQALSSFHLEDGTVLSTIDHTATDIMSLLHPNLVPVVSVPNNVTNSSNMELTLPSTSPFKHKRESEN